MSLTIWKGLTLLKDDAIITLLWLILFNLVKDSINSIVELDLHF